jgi:hypothetical protein
VPGISTITAMPTTYEIVIGGRASARVLRPLVDEFTIDNSSPDVTRLVGDITDASQLHGVLAHLTSLNAEVISVMQAGNRRLSGQNDTHGASA